LFDGGWARYRHEVFEPFQELKQFAAKLGVNIVCDVSSPEMSTILSATSNILTIFVSHWDDDKNQVEMRDGMISIQSVVDLLPNPFGGVLDCCICLPQPLVRAIRLSRPTAPVFFAECRRTPFIWFKYYEDFFWYLEHHDASYFQATKEVMSAWVAN